MRRTSVPAMSVAAILIVGCSTKMGYEWHDDQFVRPVVESGRDEAEALLDSSRGLDRLIGCRALAVLSREARSDGDVAGARALTDLLLAHYPDEGDDRVCRAMVGICLRNAGRDDERVTEFLLERLELVQQPAAAAYTLASLRPAQAFEALREAFRLAGNPGQTDEIRYEFRYELLGALWLLGDPRAIPIIEQVVIEAPADWPEQVHGMDKSLYVAALQSRLERLRRLAAE